MAKSMQPKNEKPAQAPAEPVAQPEVSQAPEAPSAEQNAASGQESGQSGASAEPMPGAPEAEANDAMQQEPGAATMKAKSEAKSAAWQEQAQAKVEVAKGFENLSPAEQRALVGSHPQGFNGLK